MRVRHLLVAFSALTLVGCGERWPADTVAKPSFGTASSHKIAKHKFMSYSLEAEALLPAYAKARTPNIFVGPKGAEVYVYLSRPWPMEEEAMPTLIGQLKEGKPLSSGDSVVVARPWIGSKELKEPNWGRSIERYLMMSDALFLDVIVRTPDKNEAARAEGMEMVQHLFHSIKRAPYVQATAYRDSKEDQSASKIAPLASASSLR